VKSSLLGILAALCLGTAAAPLQAAHAKGGGGNSYDLRRDSVEAAVVRGSIAFRTYCVLFHGANGEGNGRAAAQYVPRPANLTVSVLSDEQKKQIIRGGGASVGRSPFMPPWGQELTDEQIRDLLAFLRAIDLHRS